MGITINGSSAAGNIDLGTNGTITDLAEGGLPDGKVTPADLKSSSGTAGSGTYYRGDGAWGTISSVGGATGVTFDDNVISKWGTGEDLHIYHDATNSWIINKTGNLNFYAKHGEYACRMIPDGAVELYHDNTKVVETDANGLQFDDGKGITLGTDDDIQIYQSGTDSVFKKTVAGAIQFNHSLSSATTGIPWRFDKTNNSTSNNERHNMFSFGLPGVNRGLAQCGSSNSEAPQWAASSDYRIKENFRPYTGGWDAIKAIPVQLYDEKSPSYWTQGADKKNMKGWKAHEVQAVIPEAVTGTKDAVVTQALIDAGQYQQSELNHIIPQQLGTASMIPDLIGALQQAMTKIETLETKVAALEAG